MKAYALSDLELDEVSFCDRGANELSKVVLYKRQSEPQPTSKSSADYLGEEEIIMDDEFRFSKDQPGYSLVAKCAAAGETGELGNLSKADFDAALTSVAKAFADEYGVTFEKAYSAILATPIGSQLYDGYLAAPHAPAPVQKVEPEKVPDAWRAIEKEAAKIRRDEPRLSEPAAIAKVLRQQPHLYDQYEAECGRG